MKKKSPNPVTERGFFTACTLLKLYCQDLRHHVTLEATVVNYCPTVNVTDFVRQLVIAEHAADVWQILNKQFRIFATVEETDLD